MLKIQKAVVNTRRNLQLFGANLYHKSDDKKIGSFGALTIEDHFVAVCTKFAWLVRDAEEQQGSRRKTAVGAHVIGECVMCLLQLGSSGS